MGVAMGFVTFRWNHLFDIKFYITHQHTFLPVVGTKKFTHFTINLTKTKASSIIKLTVTKYLGFYKNFCCSWFSETIKEVSFISSAHLRPNRIQPSNSMASIPTHMLICLSRGVYFSAEYHN